MFGEDFGGQDQKLGNTLPYLLISLFWENFGGKNNIEKTRHLFWSKATAELAMDCRVDLRWYFRCGCPIQKSRPFLGFPTKNQGSFFNSFVKSRKHELVRPKIVFLAILAKF